MKKALFLSSVVVSGYATVFAQQGQVQGGQLMALLVLAQNIVSALSPLLVSLAVIAFFWFLVNFIWLSKDNPENQQKNLKGIWMSVLAIFVMVSIWGIITVIGGLLGIRSGGDANPYIPRLPGASLQG